MSDALSAHKIIAVFLLVGPLTSSRGGCLKLKTQSSPSQTSSNTVFDLSCFCSFWMCSPLWSSGCLSLLVNEKHSSLLTIGSAAGMVVFFWLFYICVCVGGGGGGGRRLSDLHWLGLSIIDHFLHHTLLLLTRCQYRCSAFPWNCMEVKYALTYLLENGSGQHLRSHHRVKIFSFSTSPGSQFLAGIILGPTVQSQLVRPHSLLLLFWPLPMSMLILCRWMLLHELLLQSCLHPE